LADRVPAEEVGVRHFAHVHAVGRLEEQTVGVDQAHQGKRRLADARREAGQIVEAGLAPGVEHTVTPQSRKAGALFGTARLAPRYCSFWTVSRHFRKSMDVSFWTGSANLHCARCQVKIRNDGFRTMRALREFSCSESAVRSTSEGAS